MQVSREVLRALAPIAAAATEGRFRNAVVMDGEAVALDGRVLMVVGGPRPEAAELAVIPAATAKAAAAGLSRGEEADVTPATLQVPEGATFALPPAELPVPRESLAKLCAAPSEERFVGRFSVDLLSMILSALTKLGVGDVELYEPLRQGHAYVLRGTTCYRRSSGRGGEPVYVLFMPLVDREPYLADRRPRFATEERPPEAAPASGSEAGAEAAPAE